MRLRHGMATGQTGLAQMGTLNTGRGKTRVRCRLPGWNATTGQHSQEVEAPRVIYHQAIQICIAFKKAVWGKLGYTPSQ